MQRENTRVEKGTSIMWEDTFSKIDNNSPTNDSHKPPIEKSGKTSADQSNKNIQTFNPIPIANTYMTSKYAKNIAYL